MCVFAVTNLFSNISKNENEEKTLKPSINIIRTSVTKENREKTWILIFFRISFIRCVFFNFQKKNVCIRMTDEADEAPRDTHLPSPMEAKEFPGQVRFLALIHMLNK